MLDISTSIIYERCQIQPDKTVIVGVSGGADSLCLMDVLLQAGLPLVICHYNHHLRVEAEAEASYVEELAARRNVRFVLGEGDVSGSARDKKISIEEAARILRYQFLFAQAARWNAQAVAVAHHADDQVETVLMHLLRGAGLDGLVGMPVRSLPNFWSERIPLVRPLLSAWREDIAAYCREQDLQPTVDITNQDVAYTRNRVRYELIPFLEQYNPRFKLALWRMGKVLGTDLGFLEEKTQVAWLACLAELGDGWVSFQSGCLAEQPPCLQQRLLRRAAATLERQDIDFEMIERATQALSQPPVSKQLDFGRGLRMFWEGSRVWLAAWEAALPGGNWPQTELDEGGVLPLAIPACESFPNGWQLIIEELPGEIAWSLAINNPDPYQAFVNPAIASLGLKVRTRLPGDTIQPLGLEAHTQKLSDFMINQKIPRRARRKWPLICAGEEVVWVPGYALSHMARLQPGEKWAVHLHLRKPA